MSLDTLPDWLPGVERLPSKWGEQNRTWAPNFTREPDLLVIHSASVANFPAEYLYNPETVAAAHFAFYEGRVEKLPVGIPHPTPMTFVQMASLKHSVPHCGGSVCMGDRRPNMRSIGIELPAAHNSYDLFQVLLNAILVALTPLKFWTEHKMIDVRKRDPVPGTGFSAKWLSESGLICVGMDKIA